MKNNLFIYLDLSSLLVSLYPQLNCCGLLSVGFIIESLLRPIIIRGSSFTVHVNVDVSGIFIAFV